MAISHSPSSAEVKSICEQVGAGPQLKIFGSLPEYTDIQAKAEQFCTTASLPSARDELWRYTKPELFSWKSLQKTEPTETKLEIFGSKEKSVPTSVVLNDPQVLASLASQKLFFQGNPSIDNLQLAYASDTVTIQITKSLSNEEPILLSRLLSGCTVPVAFIELKAGVTCTIIEDLDSESEHQFNLPQTQFLLRANSSLQFVSLQRLAKDAQYYGRFKFFLDRDAQLNSVFLSLGAQVSRTDIECVVTGPGANANVSCLYLFDGKRHVDFHTEQQHMAPHCYSNLQCKGALRDYSRGVYFGFIRVAEGSQKTDAYQKAKTMLLSKNARADNIPNLEIKANDVKCSHGASVSPVSGEELFYLRSRGISQQAAEILLLQGFFEDSLQKISNKNIQEYCMTRVIERL